MTGPLSHDGTIIADLAGSPARAEAVRAILGGFCEHAEPDDGDMVAAELWARDVIAAENVVDRAAIRRSALEALRASDILATVVILRQLPPRELAPLAERLRRIGGSQGSA